MTSAELKAAIAKQQDISNGLPTSAIQTLSAQVIALSDALEAAEATIADHETRIAALESV